MKDNKIPIWVQKEMYKNPLFSYEHIGFVFDRSVEFKDLHRYYQSYLLLWVFENIAEGFSELLTEAPSFKKEAWDLWLEKCKEWYSKKMYPLYRKRKNAFTFHYGESASYSDISDVDITSKAFGPNDNFTDDSPSELDKIYNF